MVEKAKTKKLEKKKKSSNFQLEIKSKETTKFSPLKFSYSKRKTLR